MAHWRSSDGKQSNPDRLKGATSRARSASQRRIQPGATGGQTVGALAIFRSVPTRHAARQRLPRGDPRDCKRAGVNRGTPQSRDEVPAIRSPVMVRSVGDVAPVACLRHGWLVVRDGGSCARRDGSCWPVAGGKGCGLRGDRRPGWAPRSLTTTRSVRITRHIWPRRLAKTGRIAAARLRPLPRPRRHPSTLGVLLLARNAGCPDQRTAVRSRELHRAAPRVRCRATAAIICRGAHQRDDPGHEHRCCWLIAVTGKQRG